MTQGKERGKGGREGEREERERRTQADDDVPREERDVREEDERAADADDAHEAEKRYAREQVERDRAWVIRTAQRAPVLVQHDADVD